MGCTDSKLDKLRPVALCRDRYHHLSDAVRHRHALAASHSSFVHSLNSLSLSLHSFLLPSLPSHSLRFAKHTQPSPPTFTQTPIDTTFPVQVGVFDPSFSFQDYPSTSFYPPYAVMGSSGHFDPASLPPRHPSSLPSPASSRRFISKPPPSPPKVSPWDFLNPFESSFHSYNRVYTPSWSSKEVREQEGIPDLEDEFGVEMYSNPVAEDEEEVGCSQCGSSFTAESEEGEVELREFEEEVERPRKLVPSSRAGRVVVEEVTAQFDRASLACKEAARLLDVGRIPIYHAKHEVNSSRLMYGMTPTFMKASTISQSSVYRGDEQSECSSSSYLRFDTADRGPTNRKLSSILQKLYVWEKKLHQEVRAEEKMRILHNKKCKQLKRLEETGLDSNKADTTRELIKKLSTKIRIAMQVIDSISNRLNKLRDEELLPQIKELIHGLVAMWKVMRECHRSQSEALIEGESLDSLISAYAGKLSDADVETAVQLVSELLNWIDTFSTWIDSQKKFVQALNRWLKKCLNYEPEMTDDGMSLSPTKLGAPPIFIICSSWSGIVDNASEGEVVEAIHAFATSVVQVWQQYYYERRQTLLENREMDRMLRVLEKNDQKIHKKMDAISKRFALVSSDSDLLSSGELVLLSHVTESSLHLRLKNMCQAMERFAGRFAEAYEQLGDICDEDG